MPDPSPIDQLRRATELLADIPDPAAASVSAGLMLYLAEAPSGMTLPRALGLVPAPGKSTWCEAQKKERRDAALRAIRQQSFPDVGITQTAREIVPELVRYKKYGSRSTRLARVPKELLDTAVDAGNDEAKIPGPRRMLDILRSE